MKKENRKRILVSFDERCPMRCKHCYTYDLEEKNPIRTCDEIVESISNEEFDIIYISKSYENFMEQKRGIELCEKLYARYKKDLFIITRCFLDGETIQNLTKLNNIMKREGKQLILATSICADESYVLIENSQICPEPNLRLNNLWRANQEEIKTVLMLRPIFPSSIVPTKEYFNIIEKAKKYVNAIVFSGLIATDRILGELKIDKKTLCILEDGDSEYLDNIERERIVYLDVEKEMKEIECYSVKEGIPCFRHSMPALNYLLEK